MRNTDFGKKENSSVDFKQLNGFSENQWTKILCDWFDKSNSYRTKLDGLLY